MALLAHISDLHLDGGERATERVTRVLDHLRALSRPVDALLVTGDVADDGSLAAYELAAKLLDAPFPVLTCPGNHDDRAAFRQGLLGEAPSAAPLNRLHHVAGVAILMADSTIPGHGAGLLDAETLAWIDGTLDDLAVGVPAVLALHHPPVDLYHPLPDSIRLRNPEDLAGLLAAHPEVVATLTGHAHTGAAATFAGRPLVMAPGTVWTIRMPWELPTADGAAYDENVLADKDAPPGVAFHLVGEGPVVTHFRGVL